MKTVYSIIPNGIYNCVYSDKPVRALSTTWQSTEKDKILTVEFAEFRNALIRITDYVYDNVNDCQLAFYMEFKPIAV